MEALRSVVIRREFGTWALESMTGDASNRVVGLRPAGIVKYPPPELSKLDGGGRLL